MLRPWDRASSYISIVKPTRCTTSQFILEQYTLRVSDGLSVHHQEFKTVHAASYHACSGGCLLAAASMQPPQPAWYDAACTVLNS